MKTSLFDMNFILPPLVLMTEVEKEMPTNTTGSCWAGFWCQENLMKTSIFDMNFTLPPLVEMTEVVKDMNGLLSYYCDGWVGEPHENIHN